jgi:protein-L-isoaspartate(D-aspartate) O-methyltransferase
VSRRASMPLSISAERLIEELRRAGITDERVLAAMGQVPRDQFVPAAFVDHAWDNVALPIGQGQTISQPLVVALMTVALELTDRHKVLEIGTGSGYQTAVLAPLCRRVFTIERHQVLHHESNKRFAALRLGNVTTRFGDGTKGWAEPAPFDRILLTAAAAKLPKSLPELLAPGGILVAPVGEEKGQQMLVRLRRTEDGFETEELGAVRFVPLVEGLPRNPRRLMQAAST